MGWFGAQGERYFLDERLSVFVGLGYTPSLDQGDPTGPTFAAGLRTFTSGAKHRLFVEGSSRSFSWKPARWTGEVGCMGPGFKAAISSSPRVASPSWLRWAPVARYPCLAGWIRGPLRWG